MADFLKALRRRKPRPHPHRRAAHPHHAHHPRPLGGDRRVAVVGLGRFGVALAEELMRKEWDVLGVDRDPGLVQRLSDLLTNVAVADCTDPEALRQLGVNDLPCAVVCIGSHIEASILTTTNLLEAGVPTIWSKAISRQHGQILRRLGAHHVVLPEHEMGERVAHLVTGRMMDFIQFDEDFALVKTVTPTVITGVPLGRSEVRDRHGVTVVAVKRHGEGFRHPTSQTILEPGDVIIITGATEAVEAFADLS